MGLLSEQVRVIKDEENLVTDTANYDITSDQDYATRTTKNITLAAESYILITFRGEAIYTSSNTRGNVKVLVDSVPILSTGSITGISGVPGLITRAVIVKLAAGAHTVEFQSSKQVGTGTIRITDIYIGKVSFADIDAQAYNSGTVSCPATTLTTLINQNFTIPATRKLAAGSIKAYVIIVQVHAERDAQRVSKMKDPGESDEANFFNWKIYLDDVQQSWAEGKDDANTDTSNPTYAEGAYGRLEKALLPSTTYNLKIKVYNGFGSAYDGRANVRIIICPWILPTSDTEVLSLDFPQGSTFYIILEPLWEDISKAVKIGKKRAVSFGDATDYYSTASGTGILSHNYTFETIEVENSVLLMSGHGGCVSVLGVDVR